MRDPEAVALPQAAVSLIRSHPRAPALDVLNLVMCGGADQVLDFNDPAAPNGNLAAHGAPFGAARPNVPVSWLNMCRGSGREP